MRFSISLGGLIVAMCIIVAPAVAGWADESKPPQSDGKKKVEEPEKAKEKNTDEKPSPKKNKRVIRADRWGIAMRYSNGEELFAEWAKMKVIIVLPEGDPDAKNDFTKFRVYRDLTTKPPEGKVETGATLNTLDRVWFFDPNRDSVGEMAKYLKLEKPPKFIAYFIPRELEEELLKQELAFANKTEAELNEGWQTTFQISRDGEKFVARVLEQKKKDPPK
jgi:hypothetical protein